MTKCSDLNNVSCGCGLLHQMHQYVMWLCAHFVQDTYSEALWLTFLPCPFLGEYRLAVYLLDLYSRPFAGQRRQALNTLIGLLIVKLEAWGVAEGFWSGDGHASFPTPLSQSPAMSSTTSWTYAWPAPESGTKFYALTGVGTCITLDGQFKAHYSHIWLRWLSWCERPQYW